MSRSDRPPAGPGRALWNRGNCRRPYGEANAARARPGGRRSVGTERVDEPQQLRRRGHERLRVNCLQVASHGTQRHTQPAGDVLGRLQLGEFPQHANLRRRELQFLGETALDDIAHGQRGIAQEADGALQPRGFPCPYHDPVRLRLASKELARHPRVNATQEIRKLRAELVVADGQFALAEDERHRSTQKYRRVFAAPQHFEVEIDHELGPGVERASHGSEFVAISNLVGVDEAGTRGHRAAPLPATVFRSVSCAPCVT